MSTSPTPASAPSPIGRWLAVLATVVVVATLAAAFMVMRSPSEERQVTLDLRRVQDLMQLGHAVDAHVAIQGRLPPDLATLAKQPGSLLPAGDPVTGAAYGYEIEGDRRYRLCAVFDTDTAVTRDAALGPGDWTHGAGRHCFDRIAAARGVGATVPAMPVAPGTERSAPAERVP